MQAPQRLNMHGPKHQLYAASYLNNYERGIDKTINIKYSINEIDLKKNLLQTNVLVVLEEFIYRPWNSDHRVPKPLPERCNVMDFSAVVQFDMHHMYELMLHRSMFTACICYWD